MYYCVIQKHCPVNAQCLIKKKNIAYLSIHLKTLLRNSVNGRIRHELHSQKLSIFSSKISFLNRMQIYSDSASPLYLELGNNPHLYQTDSCNQLPDACTMKSCCVKTHMSVRAQRNHLPIPGTRALQESW